MDFSIYSLLHKLNEKKVMYNDLWRYSVNDDTWAWVAGSNQTSGQGVYGLKGVADKNNTDKNHIPGARWAAVGLYDSYRREFWLSGGYGLANSTIDGT